MQVDSIIVGGGLAGVWLAYGHIRRGKSFVLYDLPSQNHSSRVAAGIYNPVLAKRKKLAYRAAEIYPGIEKSYHELENHTHAKFHFPYRSVYIIESLRELNDWAALAMEDGYADFIRLGNERLDDAILSDFGYLEFLDSGWVDIPVMLDAFAASIHSPDVYKQEAFHHDGLKWNDENFTYADVEAKHIIFCEGNAVQNNPLTAKLKLKPAKGEVLLIRTHAEFEDLVPQNGVFMLPVGNGSFRVGSNFTWENTGLDITESARDEIINKWLKWYRGEYEMVSQVAGIRPSSLDRRPLLGRLDVHPRAYLLNGLGSKGVSLAPFFSNMLLDLVFQNKPVDSDVDVKRFLR